MKKNKLPPRPDPGVPETPTGYDHVGPDPIEILFVVFVIAFIVCVLFGLISPILKDSCH